MKLFISEITGSTILLSEAESYHLSKVLRTKLGEEILVTNGIGTMVKGVVKNVHPKHSTIKVLEQWEEFGKPNYKLDLAIAPTKSMDRFEFVLEKAVEFGIDNFYPILSYHSERKQLNLNRCEKIIQAAVKQSLKAYVPKIHPMIKFDGFVKQTFQQKKLIAHCNPELKRESFKSITLKSQNILMLIGPEGDFSNKEIKLAETHGFQSVSLGTQRLRTETAAIQVTSVMSWENQH